jgi:TQO small subunit DoxD
MFSTYPDELPGIGLLLLRVVSGAVLIFRGAWILSALHDRGFVLGTISLLTVVGGLLLLVGYLTRLGATLVVIASLGNFVPSTLAPGFAIFASRLVAVFAAAIAAALMCTGPGAFSFDARLFGRHEIVIPRKPDPRTSPSDPK